MQRLHKLVLIIVLLGLPVSLLHAQTTIFDQTLLTQESFNTFTPVSVTGTQTWNFSAQYGAVCSGYSGGQNYANEDWFISPAMNLAGISNAQLAFSHTRGPGALVNVGLADGWYEVFATANYTGNPATTQWVDLGLNQSIANAWDYVSSGGLVIPDAAKSANSRIAFRYKSSASQSATWEVKNVKVTGQDPNTAVFKITNWNTEWLGCTQFGPDNETLQINNVAAAMLSMDADIYCIQEVINTPSHPSIATLVSLLGSNEWGGVISPSNTGDCNQRQGIIYRKSKVQFVDSSELSNGNGSQGNTYYYNWTNGRFPSLYNVKLIAGSTLIPVSLVNIHSKAQDNDGTSYTRRKGGSEGLKGILDGSAYNTKNVIVIGDFNDYLIGTASPEDCSCTLSPYKNFMDDPTHYTGITKDIVDEDTNWGTHPIIENIIISNELVSNYVANSAAQEVSVPQTISNYYNTTSDHLPVSARFQFTVLETPDHGDYAANSWTIYPNPVKNELNIAINGMVDDTNTEIYDLTGRLILHEKLNNGTINVSTLPSGIYIFKMGNSNAKFVKE